MKYRILVDLSFNTKEDADAFSVLVDDQKAKLYKPILKEVLDRPDLYTYNRLTKIRDYDDEGNNQVGVQTESRELINAIEVK